MRYYIREDSLYLNGSKNIYLMLSRKETYFFTEEEKESVISTVNGLSTWRGYSYIRGDVLQNLLQRRIHIGMKIHPLPLKKDQILATVSILRIITNDSVKSGGVVI